MSDAAGLILAGGAGRRYGRPKAEAILPDGRTFLDACSDTMQRAGLGIIAATVRPVPEPVLPFNVRPVVLPDPDVDMFGSIRQGLKFLVGYDNWTAVIVQPVDHPLVAASTIRRLSRACTTVAIPTLNGRHGHPVCLARPVAETIASGNHNGPTLREVVKDAGYLDVEVEDAGVRANCNTPDALAAAWRKMSSGKPK